MFSPRMAIFRTNRFLGELGTGRTNTHKTVRPRVRDRPFCDIDEAESMASHPCAKRLIPLFFLPLTIAVAQRNIAVRVQNDAADVAAKPEPRQRIFAEPSAIVQKLLRLW